MKVKKARNRTAHTPIPWRLIAAGSPAGDPASPPRTDIPPADSESPPRADMVLGDRDGASCGADFTAFVAGVAEEEAEASAVEAALTDVEPDKLTPREALDLLLEVKDRSTKKEVKAVKPTHLDAGAEVEAEISSGPYRFVYRMRFHKQAETSLTVLAPAREQVTGDEAHDRVRAILATN